MVLLLHARPRLVFKPSPLRTFTMSFAPIPSSHILNTRVTIGPKILSGTRRVFSFAPSLTFFALYPIGMVPPQWYPRDAFSFSPRSVSWARLVE